MIMQSVLPPAMDRIVEEMHLQNVNLLTQNRVYACIGSNGALSSDPSVLHFGGFELGKVFKQVFRIINTSPVSRRIHIIPPTTPHFKAYCENKKGFLAPGLSEEITVEFTPKQWRYYYDCLRIHCEPENLVVPLHAYPIMNVTKFPSHVHFGKCAIGETLTKKVKIECKVPIVFEFQILEKKSNPRFHIKPMKGIIPAHGHMTLEVTFSPTMLRSEEYQVEVQVAEFNSRPVLCTITGFSLPGLTKEAILKGAIGLSTPDMAALDGTLGLKAAALNWPVNKGGGTVKGGAGGGDAFTVMQIERRKEEARGRDCRITGPIKTSPPVFDFLGGPQEVEVDGIYVPNTLLNTTADVAYVLNQHPGKLRIKDIKQAITTKKVELEIQQQQLSSIMAEGMGQGVHPLERPEVPMKIKAALFQLQLQQAVESEKKIVLGSGVSVGEDVMTAEAIAEAQQKREDQHLLHQLNIELEAMRRLKPELKSNGALNLKGVKPSENGDASEEAKENKFVPEWRLLEANDWKKRTLALQRFTQAVHKIVYQMRRTKRLAKMQDFLAQVGFDKERLAEESANPVLLVTESDRPGTAPTKHLKPEMVRVRPLPLYRDVNFVNHDPVSAGHYTDFDELGPMSTKVPLEYKVLGYEAEIFPGWTPYAPPLMDQLLLKGAQEEHPFTHASGIISPRAQMSSMPDSCKQMPYVALEIGNRYSEDRVYNTLQPSWGMDSTHAIQPAIYPIHDSTAHDAVASGSVRALRGCPLLCERWLPRREVWQVQLTPEFVPGLMTGPDSAAVLVERPDDADKPAISISSPSTEEIFRYLPPPRSGPDGAEYCSSIPYSSKPKESEGPPASSPPPSPKKGSGKLSTPPTTAKGTKGTVTAAAPAPTTPILNTEEEQATAAEIALEKDMLVRRGKQPFELMRQRRQDEVDARKRNSQVSTIGVVDKRLMNYNEKLLFPVYFDQKM
ncbi:hypothetical protein CEUSTIGMA_g12530.t1 [Chlamydomonas eustigma]|uniref:HYDIN/VesB/CFA65-like Ig-like domain-containing protein n=1 Tax=Chlamydomonas eustigma TaxID=1157962 RepID=A0A250XQN3_9CHLO|nr:hypothetical protein CEUSTIGMA_g12530.t1 [Chlamydomonas eustigma]|eukprot:GAX85110.1 hypothetical protein CEUSTIGMA_g12530.t1 [Chlamydomonas eustigma]